MIDARAWRRPAPLAIRSMIPPSLTQQEIARRLGLSERRVRYWVQRAETDYRITYVEWLALQVLLSDGHGSER